MQFKKVIGSVSAGSAGNSSVCLACEVRVIESRSDKPTQLYLAETVP